MTTIHEQQNATPLLTSSEIFAKEAEQEFLNTGSCSLNDLLNGGVATGTITEVFGEFSTGKTQLALTLTAYVVSSGSKVVYIDTENTFRAKRVVDIAMHRNLGHNIKENVLVAKPRNTAEMLAVLDTIEEELKKGKTKLIVVDSLIAHFRAEFIGREKLAERQAQLTRFLYKLTYMAEDYNVAVFVTNQAMSSPDNLITDPVIHLGGKVVSHFCNYRLYLRKGKKGTRVAKLVDACDLPEGEALFKVTPKGVCD